MCLVFIAFLTNNKQQIANNKQQTRNNKQQTANNETYNKHQTGTTVSRGGPAKIPPLQIFYLSLRLFKLFV